MITQQHYSRPYTAFVAITRPMLCLAKYKIPVSILKFAASVALSIVSAGYFLVNVAFFLAPWRRKAFRASAIVVGGHFLTNVFGKVADERAYSYIWLSGIAGIKLPPPGEIYDLLVDIGG